jgi:hypothetical protein
MSLKAFHIVFVVASILVSLSFSVWGFLQYKESHYRLDAIYGVSGIGAGGGGGVYGKAVLRKMRHISYL